MNGGSRLRTAAVLLALLALGCAEEPGDSTAPGDPVSADSLRPAQESQGLHVKETVLGRTRWELRAARAVSLDDPPRTDLEDVTLRFFDPDGALGSVLTADLGEVDRQTQRLVARRNVVVETPEGERLETSILVWDEGDKKIRSQAPVRIVDGENVTTGVGFVADPDLDEFEILEDVRVRVRDTGEDADE